LKNQMRTCLRWLSFVIKTWTTLILMLSWSLCCMIILRVGNESNVH